jgi:hypothetical protein
MAIAVLVEGSEFTQAQYDSVVNEVMPAGRMPPGLLFHVGGPTEAGWRVVDIWESQEAFEKFSHETLAPAMQKAGYSQQPNIQVWPVHNTVHTH